LAIIINFKPAFGFLQLKAFAKAAVVDEIIDFYEVENSFIIYEF
jgi:hypothetical protein